MHVELSIDHATRCDERGQFAAILEVSQTIADRFRYKDQPHAAMLHTCDGTFQTSCDTSKSHAMCCDAFSNMLGFLLPILEFLGCLLSDFQTVCSIVMGIQYPFM